MGKAYVKASGRTGAFAFGAGDCMIEPGCPVTFSCLDISGGGLFVKGGDGEEHKRCDRWNTRWGMMDMFYLAMAQGRIRTQTDCQR